MNQYIQELKLINNIKSNYIEKVLMQLKNESIDINYKDEFNESFLHIAVERLKDNSIAKALIEYGIDINITNYEKETPLFKAIKNKNKELVTLLIEKGANISLTNSYQVSIISLIVLHNMNNIVIETLSKLLQNEELKIKDKYLILKKIESISNLSNGTLVKEL